MSARSTPTSRRERLSGRCGAASRQGIHLPKSTMGDMVQVVAEKGRLILAQCQKEMLAASHLQMDETPLTVVAEEGQGTKRGFLWVYRARIGPLGHPATIEMVLMEFHFSRGKAVPCSPLLYPLECEFISLHATVSTFSLSASGGESSDANR
jgi:hypothetical protein